MDTSPGNSDDFSSDAPLDRETLRQIADRSVTTAGGRHSVPSELGWTMVLARIPRLSSAWTKSEAVYGVPAQPRDDAVPSTSAIPSQSRDSRQDRRQPSSDIDVSDWRAIPGMRRRLFSGIMLRPGQTLVASTLMIALLAIGWGVGKHRVAQSLSTQMSVYTTANAERATILLPDSSIAVLNVGSRLEVPGDYGIGHRSLRLTGEALFTVGHRSGVPVVVLTNSSATRVLGTTFSVREYATDTIATVAVRDGKVQVGTSVLTAGDRVAVTRAGMQSFGRGTSNQFLFADGVLALPLMSFGEAIPELNRWYNADIQVADTRLMLERIEGQFPVGSLSDLVERLEWTFNVKVVRHGRTLTIYPRN